LHTIGVNPANLGWQSNHAFSFTILGVGLSGQSQGMNFTTLMNALQSTSLATKAASWQQIMGAPGGMNVNADITWFAMSFRIPKVPGTIALNVQDKIVGNGFLGPNSVEALTNSNDNIYNDQTLMSALNGTSLYYTHYREINVDYGVPLLNVGGNSNNDDPDIAKCFYFSKKDGSNNDDRTQLFGGVGFKYIFGLADINANVANGGINAIYDMSSSYPNVPTNFFNAPGQGYSFDLGLGAKIKRWTFGWSLTDIGSITWKHAQATTGDTSVSLVRNGSDLITEIKNGTLAGTFPYANYTEDLQAKMRMGISYKLSNRILLSSDFIVPLNKIAVGLTGPYFAVGAQVKVYKVISLSAGLATASGYGWGIPLGITIAPNKHVEFYAGTADVTAFTGKTNNANVSAAIGLFRFYL